MKKLTRILTLLCFFNFSGIHNGYSHLVVEAGSMQTAQSVSLVGGIASQMGASLLSFKVLHGQISSLVLKVQAMAKSLSREVSALRPKPEIRDRPLFSKSGTFKEAQTVSVEKRENYLKNKKEDADQNIQLADSHPPEIREPLSLQRRYGAMKEFRRMASNRRKVSKPRIHYASEDDASESKTRLANIKGLSVTLTDLFFKGEHR